MVSSARTQAIGGTAIFMQERTCCFTGNRIEKLPKEQSEIDAIVFRLDKAIDTAIGHGYSIFLQGGCTGIDLMAAEIVHRKKQSTSQPLTLITVVPFIGQTEHWEQEWLGRYENVLNNSDAVITLRQKIAPFAKAKAFNNRNRFMVDNSGFAIAVYGGGKGGTYNTIEYAKSLGKMLYIIPTDREEKPIANFKIKGTSL